MFCQYVHINVELYNMSFIHTEFICYDDGCHLRKYAHNSRRKDLTETTKRLAEIEIVVDKMHMSGHTDKWCKTYCDPNKFAKLEDVRNCSYVDRNVLPVHNK